MHNNTFFSIIVPCFNGGEFLDECLQSIMNQSFQNFELIIINDGSTDNSLSIALKYKNNYPEKINLINQKNKGEIRSRLKGMNVATSDYIFYVDADDVLSIDALELVNNAITTTKSDLLIFDLSTTADFKTKLFNYSIYHLATFEHESKNKIYEYVANYTMNSIVAKVFKKELFKPDFPMEDYSDVIVGIDLIHSLPIVNHAKKIVYIQDDIYFYRQHKSNITNRFNHRYLSSEKKAVLLLKDYLKNWNISDYEQKIYGLYLKIIYRTFKLFTGQTRQNEVDQLIDFLRVDPLFLESLDNIEKHNVRKKIYYFNQLVKYNQKIGVNLYLSSFGRLEKEDL